MNPKDIIQALDGKSVMIIRGITILADVLTTFPDKIKGKDFENFATVFTVSNQVSSAHSSGFFRPKGEITISIEDLDQLPGNLRKIAASLEQLKSSLEQNSKDFEYLEEKISKIKNTANVVEKSLATAKKAVQEGTAKKTGAQKSEGP